VSKALTIIVAILLAVQSSLALAREDQKAALSRPTANNSRSNNWYVVVCSSRAEYVVLQAGENDNDTTVSAKWYQKDGQKRFILPDRLQSRTKVYVRMSIPEGKWQTEACVGYNGYAKKAFRFDKNNENNNVSMDDNDDSCACR
jgi:hypothetical protein